MDVLLDCSTVGERTAFPSILLPLCNLHEVYSTLNESNTLLSTRISFFQLICGCRMETCMFLDSKIQTIQEFILNVVKSSHSLWKFNFWLVPKKRIEKLNSVMLVPMVSLLMSWNKWFGPFVLTTIANLAIIMMHHTWKPESPNLPSTFDYWSTLHGKHTIRAFHIKNRWWN